MPTRNIFAAARGRTLQDADYDTYIDASVTGADRALARKLMKIMPKHQRGDFVYFDPATGRKMSNNPALADQSVAQPSLTAKSMSHASSMRRVSDYTNPCGPDQPHTGTGPYGRMLSKCGFTGGIGFVNVTCGFSLFPPGDQGNLYFEVANGPGTTAEGGFQYNSDQSVQPYIKGLNGSLINAGAKYACGQDLGIFYGTVTGPNVVFVEIGKVPSSYDPRQFWSGGQYIALDNAAWNFIPAQSGLLQNPGPDSAGVPSPCRNCAIARVTSIAQFGDRDDGAMFGVDIVHNENTIHWMQVGFGNWLNNGCGNPGQDCTLEYASNQNVYFGGEQDYYGLSGNELVVNIDGPTPSGFGPWETWDGILLPGGTFASVRRQPLGGFTAPHPPSCTPDSYGYCVAQTGGSLQYETITCQADAYAAIMQNWVGQQWYYIQNPNGGLQFYSYNGVDPNYAQCTDQPYWSPAEPKVASNDPNLP